MTAGAGAAFFPDCGGGARAAGLAAGTGAGAGAGAGEAGGDGAVDLTGADDAAVASLADAMEGAHITTIDD